MAPCACRQVALVILAACSKLSADLQLVILRREDRDNDLTTKGSDQSGGWIMGAEMSAFFIVSKALKHSSVNSKGTSFAKRAVSDRVICEKSLVNRF